VTDRVDDTIQQWRQRQPDLDTSNVAVVSRVLRAAHYLQATLDDIAAGYGLSHQGDLDVLTELYRTNHDDGLTPTKLADALLLTAGGMTVRLHRLQAAGLISRTPNPYDGRGVLVRLTDAGSDIAEHALTIVLDAQADSLRSLTSAQRNQLADLLRTLLKGLGDKPAFQPPVTANQRRRRV
jgi:DNA-binding MarR family transcriptional regulator